MGEDLRPTTDIHRLIIMKSRTSNSIWNIARSKNILALPSRIILTYALVVPHYNYGDVVYDGCTLDTNLNLERSQNYTAKALLGHSKFSSTTNALHKLNWIPLQQQRKIHQGVFIHKALKHQSSNHATTTIRNLLPLLLTGWCFSYVRFYIFFNVTNTRSLAGDPNPRTTSSWTEGV